VPLPTGTVTFLFTDLEGSTRLWEEHPEVMHDALARHDAILRMAVEAHGGYLVKTMGDGIHASFATADAAVNAAVTAQRALGSEPWGETGPLRVRMGLHTGSAEIREGDYYGPALNRAARLMAVAHGGQVVCSQVTADILRDELTGPLELTDLGAHRLRDLGRPERVFQLSAPGLATEFPALCSLDAFPSNLPLQVTSFVGRDAEFADIRGLLDGARLVTLTGVGGVGKTRLALQVAADMLPRCRDGAWFCELAAADDPDAMAQVVAAALGVAPRPGMALTASIVEFVRLKQLLVVLDNCEHLLEAASGLAEAVLQDCPQAGILATSREALDVPGERVVRVRSLPVPDPASVDLGSIEQSDAVRLFTERAAATGSSFALGASNASAVAEICRRLDGIPLAIELAAARVVSMQPAEIASRLDERFRLLTGRRRAVLERHQTLRATVDWSYSLLDERERVVFERLGVFPATFGTAAAELVVADDEIEAWDVVDALDALVAKSMLAVDEGAEVTTRYQMLETLRQYARERLDESSDADVWRRRHAEHYAAFAEAAGAALHGPDELAWRRRYTDEIDNLRVAVGWALDRDADADRELAVRIIAALSNQTNIDRAYEIGSWARRAVGDAERTTTGRRSAVLAAAGWHALGEGDIEAARVLASDALRDGLPDDCPSPAQMYVLLGFILAITGEPEQAIATVAEGRAAIEARGTAHPSDRAMLATAEASFRALSGDPTGAVEAADEVIRLARESGNPTALAAAAMPVLVATWRSQPDVAAALADESIALVRAGAGGVVFGYTLAIKAQLLARDANRAGALAALREAVSYSHDKGDLPMLVLSLDRGIQVLAMLGEHEPAARFAGIAVTGPLAAVSNLPAAEHADRDQTLQHVRAELGDAAYEAALPRGAELDYDEVVQYALGELDRLAALR
jgi:predicted ATPase/class 3 adenylate cyclase